ncbi:MAG TPA: hypothetical protein VKX16_13035 [Chloroflexota bacterium]|nr:hypothetical protein [Chloroflexota bacterium]
MTPLEWVEVLGVAATLGAVQLFSLCFTAARADVQAERAVANREIEPPGERERPVWPRFHDPRPPATEPWLLGLKAAYDAGYYRSDVDPQAEKVAPWRLTVCQKCAFWHTGFCCIHLEIRRPGANACSLFHQSRQATVEQRESSPQA